MRIYQFTNENGKQITQFNSDFSLSRIMHSDQSSHAGFIHLEKEGIIGYHQAVIPQLLLITKGQGLVRGKEDEYVAVEEGDGIFWEKEEWHETKTESGLAAIVIESEGLDPEQFMAKEKK